MPNPGYVDYARTSLSTGLQLAGGQNAIKTITDVFFGYVGAWTHLNFFWNATGASDNWQIQINFYEDSTFTTLVAGINAVRNGNMGSVWSQYGVLGPWVAIFIIPKVGGDSTVIRYNIYGTTGASQNNQLADTSSPIWRDQELFPASTQKTFFPVNTIPGRGVINLRWDINTSWNVNLLYFDWGTASYLDYTYWDNNTSGYGLTTQICIPDAPLQIVVHNANTAAHNFLGSLCAVA